MRANEKFADVILTDECTVQLEKHSRVCFRKKLQHRLRKQCAKHPVKVHIWGEYHVYWHYGCPAPFQSFVSGFVPFLRSHYPDGHCLQQENNPKHASKPIEDVLLKSTVLIGGLYHQSLLT